MKKAVILESGTTQQEYKSKSKDEFVISCNNAVKSGIEIDAVCSVDTLSTLKSRKKAFNKDYANEIWVANDTFVSLGLDKTKLVWSSRRVGKTIITEGKEVTHGFTILFYAIVRAVHAGYKDLEVYGYDKNIFEHSSPNSTERSVKEISLLTAILRSKGVKITFAKKSLLTPKIEEQAKDLSSEFPPKTRKRRAKKVVEQKPEDVQD